MYKRTCLLLMALMLVLSVLAQKNSAPPKVAPNSTPANVKLNNIADTIQYAIGSFLAQWVNNQGFLINNAPLFIRGMDDVFQNKPRLIADSSIAPLITAYQQITAKDRAFKLEQQLFTNIKQRPGLGIFPNGVHYFVLKSGQGQRPMGTDSVLIHLKGSLADGAVFEDTQAGQKPQWVVAGQLIPGLSDAIQQMPIGSRWQLYIPSALAHAEKGVKDASGNYLIPPGSAVVYEVELLQIKAGKTN
jgi:FKBP-type peptidyl-prolyl cis-trans isomerase